jgi:hypothetical protein
MKLRLYIWVTSDCNLNCPFCSQKDTRKDFSGYQMSIDEVKYIVNSCKKRNIYFDIIEITGGEATLWKNIIKGVQLFKQIADVITLVTNGNNPELVYSLDLPYWVVSQYQATAENIEKHLELGGDRVIINEAKHKRPPEQPFENVLPADCCVRLNHFKEDQQVMEYLRGKVYYCCDAYAYSKKAGLDKSIVCDFREDFILKFSNKKYDKEICKYCLCNTNVWNQL